MRLLKQLNVDAYMITGEYFDGFSYIRDSGIVERLFGEAFSDERDF